MRQLWSNPESEQKERQAHLGFESSCRISERKELCDAQETIRNFLWQNHPLQYHGAELDLKPRPEGSGNMAAGIQQEDANPNRNSVTSPIWGQNEQAPDRQGQMRNYGSPSIALTEHPSSSNYHSSRRPHGHDSSLSPLTGQIEGSVLALPLSRAGSRSDLTGYPYHQSPSLATFGPCLVSPAVWEQFCAVSGFPLRPTGTLVDWDVTLWPVERVPRYGLLCSCGSGFQVYPELQDHVNRWQGPSLQCDQCFKCFRLDPREDLGYHFQGYCSSGSWRVSRMFLPKIPIAYQVA